MRLFIALDIDEHIRSRIGRFLDGVSGFAPEARWVQLESLHITLKFIGEKAEEIVTRLQGELNAIRVPSFTVSFSGFGFFPTPKAPRVFWIGTQAGAALQQLASAIDEKTARLGIPKEERAFSPHLTLARKSGASGAPRRQDGDWPNRVFERLQQRLAALPKPEFGTMTAHEFFLYQSQLSRSGSRYTKLHSFAFASNAAAGGPENL